MNLRPYQSGDLEAMLRITLEGFDGTAIDQHIERLCGVINGHDWRWRKARFSSWSCR